VSSNETSDGMFFHTHHRHTDAAQNVHADVPLCHTGDLVPSYTQAKHTDGPQHIRVDVHLQNSVKKNNIFVSVKNIKFQETLSVGNLVTPHGKRIESISPF
jgi:hypothetical protein